MSRLIEPSLLLAQFELPPQDIELLTFCKSAKSAKVKAWVEELKLTQVLVSSAQLYSAIPQVVHLKTDLRTRYEMLEALWPAAQQCIEGLSKEFLQQPLILPEPAQKAAIVAQALQKNLLDGYTLCVKELVNQKKIKPAQQSLFQNALFRATQAIGFFMLRNAQLYTSTPAKMWLRLHSLYRVAEHYQVLDTYAQVATQSGSSTRTISDNYKKAVSLASIQPNQLSQKEIANVFTALNSWVRSITLLPSISEDQNNLYLVNLSEDKGPISKSRAKEDDGENLLELDFQNLVAQISKLNGYNNPVEANLVGQDNAPPVNSEISQMLRDHILRCWSNNTQRYQDRKKSDIEAQACIGLIDTHFHICGDTTFSQFINPHEEPEEDSFLSGGFDSLVASLSSKKKDVDTSQTPKQTIYPITLQNVSNGGYCVLWQGDLPGKVEAGELIGIREAGRRAWSLGVVRWIRQIRNGSQLGVQLLSNQPTPYAAALRNDLGDCSDFMRAFHISSSTASEFSQCLITNSAPFQENMRAKIKQDDMELDIRLSKCVFSTSKIKLFNFETLSADTEH